MFIVGKQLVDILEFINLKMTVLLTKRTYHTGTPLCGIGRNLTGRRHNNRLGNGLSSRLKQTTFDLFPKFVKNHSKCINQKLKINNKLSAYLFWSWHGKHGVTVAIFFSKGCSWSTRASTCRCRRFRTLYTESG